VLLKINILVSWVSITDEVFSKMQLALEKNTKSLQTSMREGFNQLEDKLALADQGQDEKAAELNAYADKTSSELEMAETNSKQENDDLHVRLDKEIKTLTVKFTDQLNQALEKLTQVSREVIAEGLETLLQKDFLKQNNCSVAQGFLFSCPIPYDDFCDLLEGQKKIN
jgi:hypothetical protein